jgi:type IV pilus assembly protein PilA
MSIVKTQHSNSKGFTLLEILLVVGIISILAGIVILAINPTKQLGDSRNAQRRSDVLTILNAIYQYSIDNNGDLPDDLAVEDCTLALAEIDTDASAGEVDLYTNLVVSAASSTYLVDIPNDPQASSTAEGALSGYAAVKTSSGRITVCAPFAENNVTISVTR